jgi:hypothetical protein
MAVINSGARLLPQRVDGCAVLQSLISPSKGLLTDRRCVRDRSRAARRTGEGHD